MTPEWGKQLESSLMTLKTIAMFIPRPPNPVKFEFFVLMSRLLRDLPKFNFLQQFSIRKVMSATG